MDWFSGAGKTRKFFEQPVSKAAGAIAGIFAQKAQFDQDEMCVLALLKSFLPEDESLRQKALARLYGKLEMQGTDSHKMHEIMHFMTSAAPGTPEAALPVLKKYNRLQQSEMLESFLLLAVRRGEYRPEALETIRKIALELGFTPEDFEETARTVLAQCERRTKILKSGTGIVLALIVFALFILTASWLSSLLFGLALAYVFLPLEQALERRFFPLKKEHRKVVKKERYELSQEELNRRAQQAQTNKATYLTVGIVVVGGIIVIVLLGMLLFSYLGTLQSDVENWMQRQQHAAIVVAEQPGEAPSERPAAAAETSAAAANTPAATNNLRKFNDSLAICFMQLQERFQEQPFVQSALLELHSYFATGEAQRNFGLLVLRKSGGFFAFLANFIATFASLLLNLLLTFFFFSLLLNQLAMFVNTSGKAKKRASSYLVRSVFNGRWLPAMSEEDLANGDRIISESFNKLRVWLRGYLTMVLIDMCVYTAIFWWLDVPYFGILGIVAGLGILLPYIGPVSSAALTILVTLIAGASAGQIIGILLTYALYNGVFEQFFSYPHFIGNRLGLTTLETIIVVLLGGILAGIPGMIFALPAAAVLKYIVPQIYRCWK